MQENTGIKKVGMIILLQSDIAAAVDFYQNLGLKLKFHMKEKWAELRVGELKIGLCPTGLALENNRTGVVFEVDDLMDFYQKNKDTISFVTEPKTAVHGIMASFKDPGGNILELYQPTPERVKELMRKTADKKDGCCKSEKSEKEDNCPC